MHADLDMDILSRIPRATSIELRDLLMKEASVLYNAVSQAQHNAESRLESVTAFANFVSAYPASA